MTGDIEPPPPGPRGMGCLGKGCLILSLFILFLIIACAVGLYVGSKTNSALVHGIYWAKKTHMLASEPSPIPQFETAPENIEGTKRKWRDFDRAAHEDQPARIELTADDLNNLITSNRHLRGKAFVTIDNNILHVQASLPLGEYVGREGYYLNGEIVMQTDGPSSLEHPPLSRITINRQPLPQDLLDWKFRSRRFSDYGARYQDRLNANTFEIRDGKVILNKNAR
jgi:hypothetical protein